MFLLLNPKTLNPKPICELYHTWSFVIANNLHFISRGHFEKLFHHAFYQFAHAIVLCETTKHLVALLCFTRTSCWSNPLPPLGNQDDQEHQTQNCCEWAHLPPSRCTWKYYAAGRVWVIFGSLQACSWAQQGEATGTPGPRITQTLPAPWCWSQGIRLKSMNQKEKQLGSIQVGQQNRPPAESANGAVSVILIMLQTAIINPLTITY